MHASRSRLDVRSIFRSDLIVPVLVLVLVLALACLGRETLESASQASSPPTAPCTLAPQACSTLLPSHPNSFSLIFASCHHTPRDSAKDRYPTRSGFTKRQYPYTTLDRFCPSSNLDFALSPHKAVRAPRLPYHRLQDHASWNDEPEVSSESKLAQFIQMELGNIIKKPSAAVKMLLLTPPSAYIHRPTRKCFLSLALS